MSHGEKKFWLLFFILNCLIFLPRYLLYIDSSTFIPYQVIHDGSPYGFLKFFFRRDNSDIFRLSIDFLMLTCVFYIARKHVNTTLLKPLFITYFFVILFYQIYHQSFEKIYKIPPILLSDVHMFTTGMKIIASDFSVTTGLTLAGLLALVVFLYYLIHHMLKCLRELNFGRISQFILIVLIILSLTSLGRFGFRFSDEQGFQVQLIPIIRNVIDSWDARKGFLSFDIKKLLSSNHYHKYELRKHPNLYIFFIESYGRILLDNPVLRQEYVRYVQEHNNVLAMNSWKTSSNLSLSPVSGGYSWVSYATVLYGYNFKNSATLYYAYKRPEIYEYHHLLKFLREKDYRNYRLSSILSQPTMQIPWDRYTDFFAVDHWIRFEDLRYNGKVYGFASANDQYALHFAHQYIKESGHEPYTLFFMTQNSHTPFHSPQYVAEHWQDLNDGSADLNSSYNLLTKPTVENYAKAIRFQLEFLIDFIVKQGDRNDIFILIGDHQPPVIPGPEDSLETPVHIISQDEAFVNSFIHYGFTPGLLLNNTIRNIKHEGIYSMFIKEFIRHYGKDAGELPEYRPDGVIFH